MTTVTSRPFIAPPKTNFNEDVPYMDGSLDYSQTGGRLFYKDKVLEVDFAIKEIDKSKRNKIIERFATWLAGGKGELILDDMPLVKWIALPVSTDDIQISLGRLGKCTVEFRCEPFNQFKYSTGAGIPLDSDIEIDSDIPVGWGEEFEIINGKNEITVTNDGSAYVRPIIKFDGDFDSVSITVGSNTTSYNVSFKTLEINCECFAVFTNDNDVTCNSEGDFLELAPGENTVIISAVGTGKVGFDFCPKYFYNTQY
jgi:predicted phage tail component-like protein